MTTPSVSPPTRLPHIFPGPPRTTITKLIGAYSAPIRGLMPTGIQAVSSAPPAIVTANRNAVPRDATLAGFAQFSSVVVTFWANGRIVDPLNVFWRNTH